MTTTWIASSGWHSSHREKLTDFQLRQRIVKLFVASMAFSIIVFHLAAFVLRINPLEGSPILLIRRLAEKTSSSYMVPGTATKLVLLWTDFFSDHTWKDHFARNGGSPVVELDLHRRCFFSSDRIHFANADAVIFHGRDFKLEDMPPLERPPSQRWVFYLLESPNHSGFADSQWDFVNQWGFNLTMGYTKKADIYSPYGRIRSLPINWEAKQVIDRNIANFTESFSKRPKDAVAIISNCISQSLREAIISKLRDHNITVDVWGRCGYQGLPDIEWNRPDGERNFFSQYRFYLAFENTLCDDYVTEKAFHAFYANFIAGPIPIVYGAGNYSEFFPNDSFINIGSHPNVSALISIIKELSQPDANVTSYYQWQRAMNPLYEVGHETNVNGTFVYDYYKRAGWRNLCKKLWEPTENSSTVVAVQESLGKCSMPVFADG